MFEELLQRPPPFCFGSLSWRQSCADVRPTKTILCSGAVEPHLGLPGGMCSPARSRIDGQVSQRIP